MTGLVDELLLATPGDPQRRLLVVVDQFEELFTQTWDRRRFCLTTTAQPTLQLNHLVSSDAVTALLRRYLSAFGPAAIEDFQWWSGLTRGEITPAVTALRPELIDVRIDPHPTPLFMLAEHEPDLRAAVPLPRNHVALLAYEDPALKGYHATRHRYVDDQQRNHLFNTIGEARASIVLAGRYVGTWQFHRTTRTITHTLHATIPPVTRRTVTRKARSYDRVPLLRTLLTTRTDPVQRVEPQAPRRPG